MNIRKDRTKLLGKHLLILMLLAALCRFGCPINKLLGISCPGCGLTRAWVCFLQGEWQEALTYHLLFLPAPLVFFLAVHGTMPVLQKKPLANLVVRGYLIALTGYHLLRTNAVS